MIDCTDTRNRNNSSSSTVSAVDSIVESKDLLCYPNINSTTTIGAASVDVPSIIDDKQQCLSSLPERIQRRENNNTRPHSAVTLFDLIDEDFVICNTNIGFKYCLRNKPVGSSKEGRGRTTILDQIDGLIKEDGDDTFMTSRSYPRGVHIMHRRSRSSNTSYFDLVVAEESFKYWQHEIRDPKPIFSSTSTTESKAE